MNSLFHRLTYPLRGVKFIQRLYLTVLAKRKGLSFSLNNGKIFITNGKKRIVLKADHLAYAYDCMCFFNYYHGAVKAEIIEDGYETVDYSSSKDHLIQKNGMTFRFSALPESIEGDLYVKYTEPVSGEIVFDVGAYCGLTAYHISKAVGQKGKVVCFEPDDENYANLLYNIKKHGLNNVIAVNKAMWNKTTTIQFQAEGNLGGHVHGKTSRNVHMVNVDAISFNDAVTEYGMPSLVKLDIEGAETEVFESIRDVLKSMNTRFIVEPHLMPNGLITSELFIPLLKTNDYQIDVLPQDVFSLPLVYAYKRKSLQG